MRKTQAHTIYKQEGLPVEGQPPACQQVLGPSEQVWIRLDLSYGAPPTDRHDWTENITFPQTNSLFMSCLVCGKVILLQTYFLNAWNQEIYPLISFL